MMRRRRTRRPNAPAFFSQADFTQNKTPEQVGGFILVIPPRFERGTHSLEGCCSIQLSYGTAPLTFVVRFALKRKLFFVFFKYLLFSVIL